jgi:hypothetical protein
MEGCPLLFVTTSIFLVLQCRDHWSLAVLVYPGGASPSKGVKGTPAILHLDSMEGGHNNVECNLRRWVTRENPSKHYQQSILELVFVHAEVSSALKALASGNRACSGNSWSYHCFQMAFSQVMTSARSCQKEVLLESNHCPRLAAS